MKRKKRSKTIGNANEYILKIAIGISLFVLLAASAGALNLYGAPQAISISPTEGPAGTVVTITGTGWKYPGENNESVPIWIGFANEVARGYPDTNGNFSASAKIPLDSPPGQLTLAAIVGNGGSADAYFNVTAGPTPIPTASVTPTVNQPSENCVAVEGTNCSTIPSSGSALRKPVFVYPVDGQTIDFEGSYMFKVEPMNETKEFLWGFMQNGQMVWENYRDQGTLSGNEYGIHSGVANHDKFVPGKVEVWVRALINGQWSEPAIITINLKPRSVTVTPTPNLTSTPIVTATSAPNPVTPSPGVIPKFYCIVGPGGTTGPECENQVPPPCVTNYTQNTFYPGINWGKNDLEGLNYTASELDATLRHSYENTGVFDGAWNVLQAYLGISTEQNYLNNSDGDGYHPIAFAHSGGTQTLVKKIESGKVTADYVVLAAPALLDQERLAKLIENNGVTKVKKIIIFQSERDILYLLVIGSASKYPLQWKLFENQTIAGKGDILVDTDNLSGIAVSPTDSIFVHGALRDKMVSTFYHGDYPFDGRFEGLKKKDCVQGSK